MTTNGKVAFVTGGSRGIGRAIALRLAQAGYDIGFSYCSSDVDAASLEAEVQGLGVRCAVYQASVDDSLAVRNMLMDAGKIFGQLDVLVNNAGLKSDGLAMTMRDEDWNKVIQVDLSGCFFCCREAVKLMMRKKSGSIVNISSLSGLMGQPGQCNYSAAKGGMNAFTKALAKEMAAYGIRVNAIAPGFIETDMIADVPQKVLEANKALIPMRRFGSTDEVASLALYLASGEAGYITGEIISVNGGLYM